MRVLKTEADAYHMFLLLMCFIVLGWSAIEPYKYLFWFLLALPPIILVTSLVLTYKKFRFSSLVYTIVFLHVLLLLTGAKYTYTEVPLFNVITELMGSSREHFDRLGHFIQGVTPALMAKELLYRRGYIRKTFMSYYIVMSIALAFSAFYEITEFLATILTGLPASVVLAPQGDPWDTQWDMILAIFGAGFALTLMAPLHNKQIKKLPEYNYRKPS